MSILAGIPAITNKGIFQVTGNVMHSQIGMQIQLMVFTISEPHFTITQEKNSSRG